MRGNILIIDKETQVYEKLLVSLIAHNIYHAESINGASNTISRNGIDLVYLDIDLHKGSTFEEEKLIGIANSRLGFIQNLRKKISASAFNCYL